MASIIKVFQFNFRSLYHNFNNEFIWSHPMKLSRVTVLFILFTSIFKPVYSDVDDCSGIDQALYANEYKACLRLQIAGGANVDCVECLFAQEEQTNPWVEAIGVLAAPLAYFGASAIGSYYGYKTQRTWADAYSGTNAKWANAYEQGHVQCTTRFNEYLNYSSQIGAAPILPGQAESFAEACNQQPLHQYAGFGGMGGGILGGGANPFLSAGFSPGFMSGMTGPYFGSPYGFGGIGGMTPGFGLGMGGSIGGLSLLGGGGMGYPGMGGMGGSIGGVSLLGGGGMGYPGMGGMGGSIGGLSLLGGGGPGGGIGGFGAMGGAGLPGGGLGLPGGGMGYYGGFNPYGGPGIHNGGLGLGFGGGGMNGYWGNTGGHNQFNNQQYQQQMAQQQANWQQSQAAAGRAQGNMQGNLMANQALYQNYQDAAQNLYGAGGGYGYGGAYSMPGVTSSGGGGFGGGLYLNAGFGF